MSEAMQPGLLIVYSGPSGVGKGTILAPYLAAHPETVLSVSVTTRAPRPGERDGIDYSFITRERFDELATGGGLPEYAEYSGNCYGTPRAAVETQLAAGCNVLLEIEVQGAMKVRRTFPQAVFIFVLPPSYETLRERLTGRNTETAEVVERRLAAARLELSYAAQYDYVIVNDDADKARAQLDAIICASKCRTNYMQTMIDKVCEFHEYA